MENAAMVKALEVLVDKLQMILAEQESEPMEGPEIEIEMGGKEEDKAEEAEMAASEEMAPEADYKDEMKKFFGGSKPLLPNKKGMQVGITEVAVMPGPKKGKKSAY